MALIERLMGWEATGEGEDLKIPVHQFVAALAEWNRGQATRAQVIALFNLRSEDEPDGDAIIAQFSIGAINRVEFHDILMLAEQRLGYDTPAKVRNRLGI